MEKGIVVSDLHLFSRRSEGSSRFEELTSLLNESDVLVLNGDIFDFRWATRPHSESVPEATKWLEEKCSAFPHLDIHFIPGNHDCIPQFVEAIREIGKVKLHPHYLVLGKKLFLHGDAATHRMDRDGFREFRSAWEQDFPRGRASAKLYEMADHLRLSDLTHHLWFGGGRAIRRLAWHLDRVFPEWKEEAEDCYFGHTHLPFSGVIEQGVRFHNTGSGNRGAPFSPIEFRFESNRLENLKSNEK